MPFVTRPSPYQPLIDFLVASHTDAVTLTFNEIAAIIGRPLPDIAILHNTWWRYRRNRPVMLWQAGGWEAHPDRDHLRVVFVRSSEE